MRVKFFAPLFFKKAGTCPYPYKKGLWHNFKARLFNNACSAPMRVKFFAPLFFKKAGGHEPAPT